MTYFFSFLFFSDVFRCVINVSLFFYTIKVLLVCDLNALVGVHKLHSHPQKKGITMTNLTQNHLYLLIK